MVRLSEFSIWKTLTIRKLLELKSKYKDDIRCSEIIDEAINKLHTSKARDLSTVIFFFYSHSKEIPELLNLLPSPQEVEQFFFFRGRRRH